MGGHVGTRFVHPHGSHSPYAGISAEFDGLYFTLRGLHGHRGGHRHGGTPTVLMTVDARSGRPVAVRPADASSCGGSTADSYLSNPLYVGIADYGAIPEGEYRFRAANFSVFSAAEQLQFTAGGSFEDAFGQPMHGGDWGAGRAPLHAVRVLPSPGGCGNTRRRSGFYIHGGSLTGSSGCIDIGNSGIETLLTNIVGYAGNISVRVRYTHPPPDVSLLQRSIGGAIYPGQRDPSIVDRVRGFWRELGGGGSE